MSSNYRSEVYTDARGEWRWRLRAANGKIVADSGEGYANRADCLAMLAKLFPEPPEVAPDPDEDD